MSGVADSTPDFLRFVKFFLPVQNLNKTRTQDIATEAGHLFPSDGDEAECLAWHPLNDSITR